jgi:Fur family ferric uptake transcriptional regulator
MFDSPDTLKAIRESGHRLTPQRVMVLTAIAETGGHISVEEIQRRLAEQRSAMGKATVYRTVSLLRRLHLLNEVVRGGVSHYEIADPHHRHDHMVCEHCGTAIHVPPAYLDELHDRLLRETGFELHMEHSTISGLCANCRADTAHSHSGGAHEHPHRHAGISNARGTAGG